MSCRNRMMVQQMLIDLSILSRSKFMSIMDEVLEVNSVWRMMVTDIRVG